MSYTKTTWTTGDIITATKMNKIENGVETACNYTMTTIIDNAGVLNKTVDEIAQLLSENTIPMLFIDEGYPNSDTAIGIDFILGIYCYPESGFVVNTLQNHYEADTINDYPVQSQNITDVR